jgi:formylglycine-generating enzyme required for sulfatase activity
MQTDFTDKVINSLSNREAMGMNSAYVKGTLEDSSEVYKELCPTNIWELARTVEDSNRSLYERFIAGNLLALHGDPRINTLNPTMIEVPVPMSFKMGIDVSRALEVSEELKTLGVQKEWILKESPSHEVKLKPFLLGKYPVTNSEYRDFLLDNPQEELPTSWKFGQYPITLSNHPVHTVSAETAIKYAQWLSRKTGQSFRLPTEAEWELAACSDEQREFPWGNKFSPENTNTAESGIFQSTPVGMFPAGRGKYGHLDLAGNVEEYVNDFYAPYPGADFIQDDLATTVGKYHVARGGSFTRFRDLARGKRRHGRYPAEIYVMGFRLCLDSKE